jgi:hypothetical protein
VELAAFASTAREEARSRRRVPIAALGLAATFAAGVSVAAQPPEEDPAPTPASVLAAAREQQVRDLAAWRRYRFVREVERQRLGSDGTPVEVVRLRFRVEPTGDGFNETLLWIDGREPTPREVAQHRRAGRFAAHYRGVITGRGQDVDEGYALADLLSLPSYRAAGEEVVDGVRCLRFDFEPAPEAPGGFAGRVARASQGTLWITVEGGHLARAEAHTVAAVRFAGGLVRIPRLVVRYQGRRVGEDVWLPAEIEVESEISLFGNPTRRRNRYSYSAHEAVAPGRGR